MVAGWMFNLWQHIPSFKEISGVWGFAACAIVFVKQWFMIMFGVYGRSRL
jgi:hypothetical protein